MTLPLPQLTSSEEASGYESEALEAWMESQGLLEKWNTWFSGQTGMLLGDKFIVYKYDVDRFLVGLPVVD